MTDCNECANFKQKREQTGWICRDACCSGKGPCLVMGLVKKSHCASARLGRFYGRVVE